ncbi:MAG TPA: hypothetical protein VHU13_10280 [Solirubrobacteraceae bacterium]|jgi:hypothetical protein|nr:hypothetical protein [Solirubrobacteraceae bacterium]
MSQATLAPDAAIALGIAATAMPFARSAEAEAERWLRVLRLHGEAGSALQAIGVGEGRLESSPDLDGPGGPDAAAVAYDRADPVAQVVDEAIEVAARRGRAGVATVDLLLAVMCVYGEDFDHALAAHGSGRDELLARLGVTQSASEICGD